MSQNSIGLRKIVGFGGYPGAGKDTAARLLAERDGHYKCAFADELREHITILNPVVGATFDKDTGVVHLVYFKDACSALGYDKAKFEYPEIRRLLQVYGTDVVRGKFGETTWVEFLDKKIRFCGSDVAISDARFSDTEIPYVAEKGGCLIWIDREGCGPMSHKADDGSVRDCFMYHIENNGTEDELYEKVKACLDEHFSIVDELNVKLNEKMQEVLSREYY